MVACKWDYRLFANKERGSALQKLLTKTKTGSLFVNATKDLFIIGALSIVTMYRAEYSYKFTCHSQQSFVTLLGVALL